MAFYTYLVTYNNSSCALQVRRSNYKGFCDWVEPACTILTGLSPAMQKELMTKAYRANFLPVLPCSHVWRASLEIQGEELLVYAIETKP